MSADRRRDFRSLCSVTVLLWLTGTVSAQFELISKAQPDEFYTGLGKAYIPIGQQAEGQAGQPKTNEDYIWSMATDGHSIWMGSGSGTLAIANAGGLLPLLPPRPQEFQSNLGIPFRAWEYRQSQYPVLPQYLKNFFGDWRPPRIYQYDTVTQEFIDRTPDDLLLQSTLGLRSAGVWDGVALLGGPVLGSRGINLFAFEATSGRYLGSRTLSEYSNIRRWLVANGALYTSTLNTNQEKVRGSVLKWTGNVANPFQFAVVGHLDNEGAYLAYHDGRLFVGTWATQSTLSKIQNQYGPTEAPACGIWMSPKLSTLGSLWPIHANQWTKVWTPDWYEPEPGVQVAYAMGAMESYNGWLYFGTLHYPLQGNKTFEAYYGYQPPRKIKTERRPIIVRGKGFGQKQPPTYELLYGNETVPVFQPDGQGGGTWVEETNNQGQPGQYGGSGFDNPNNWYTWSSSVHRGALYFGTADFTGYPKFGDLVDGQPTPGLGGDLWMFPQVDAGAVAVDLNGCGNPANHGIRNMVSTSAGLFLGMANSANLLTDPNDDLPDGGWEFLRLREE